MPIARLRRVTEEGVVTEPLEKTPKEEVYEFMVEKGMREGYRSVYGSTMVDGRASHTVSSMEL
jgi:hypothetical protein